MAKGTVVMVMVGTRAPPQPLFGIQGGDGTPLGLVRRPCVSGWAFRAVDSRTGCCELGIFDQLWLPTPRAQTRLGERRLLHPPEEKEGTDQRDPGAHGGGAGHRVHHVAEQLVFAQE